ncbi:hypothetical protein [Nesterenkonia flava]|uniref:Uncharacterized protein n=1 Tax=Nesterenkonia flava TaxID=469799 RepID=A0ABU1FS14_9MICC|nr:hypothetical protein [Nesterenkonia flava]MDR5711037.1 hypothetical protein [Nesterenkonia flava]
MSSARWEHLFSDFEAQWAEEKIQALEAEAVQMLELERSRHVLADRLRAHRGRCVRLRVQADLRLELQLVGVGSDWCAGVAAGAGYVVPLRSLLTAEGLGPGVREESSAAQRRLGLPSVLRMLAEAAEPVVLLGAEDELGRGRILTVGQDHLDLRSGSGGTVSVPLSGICAVRGSADFAL